MNKLAPFTLALALVSCETPLRSAQAQLPRSRPVCEAQLAQDNPRLLAALQKRFPKIDEIECDWMPDLVSIDTPSAIWACDVRRVISVTKDAVAVRTIERAGCTARRRPRRKSPAGAGLS